ncbi:MAG: methyltransferase domain-containing protein [Proteobacteria bacterium]|nr:methyltransferase domain-containing protein [Pseudomonadota bacterium]
MSEKSRTKDELVFEYKGKIYPTCIKEGNAAGYVVPFASHFCKGKGLDIGGFFEWTYPGATPINIVIEDKWDAYNLPEEKYDYIFSSHTLEHLPDYVKALEYWRSHLKGEGSVIFLYLPHPDMDYWRPINNRKHLHLLYPDDMKRLMEELGFSTVIVSERDLYWSFAVVAIL